MIDVTDADLAAAQARGRKLLAREQRASAVRYEAATGRVMIELVNGSAYAFPARLVQELQGAPDDALAAMMVDGQGFNLHWAALGVDLYVPSLLAGVFG